MSHEHRQHPERFYDDEGEAYEDDLLGRLERSIAEAQAERDRRRRRCAVCGGSPPDGVYAGSCICPSPSWVIPPR